MFIKQNICGDVTAPSCHEDNTDGAKLGTSQAKSSSSTKKSQKSIASFFGKPASKKDTTTTVSASSSVQVS